ncbi:GNAT family N-acetyltransferase [Terracoccus luteus]|uniref:L-amino acid N-acyltransferase YncA n=1 Tax=Terracoccus luteus TaxID=53356 RepID=A0A495XWQ3_9MICO|nr:GNAT family N-acetyltransferase [Terracoccus luteus]MBB2985649.1 ribosomal protein S18 acetylase RimI-like enzyme [Terracoccus luteus]MCP2171301.1 ribosomal protein S18 acetylase RimI-like enzyme [Terracoccus luteus]RKT78402.1 L-amino acid N-acyltransferase YncA [Terracoccus luteus]
MSDPASGPATPPAIRPARREDVPAVVALLADDPLGRTREDLGNLDPYSQAFDRIEADPAHVLVVAELDGVVVGTLQLSVVPGLSRRGASRAVIEGVRVAAGHRGHGLGERLVRWAIEESGRRGASLVQLTSDASRTDARRFYERLGFTASHVGFKLDLS